MIVELLQRGLIFAKRISTACIGFFLYPLLGLARIWRATMGIAVITALAVPLLSLYLGFSVYHHNSGGLFAAFATSLISAGAMTGLAVGILPISAFLWTAYTLLTYPFIGLSIGWHEGLSPLFESPYHRELRGNPNPNQNVLFEFIGQPQRGMSMQDVLHRLGEAAVNAARVSITEKQFSGLELSCQELDRLIEDKQASLSKEEIEQLRNLDVITQKLLQQYENIQRLKNDKCLILQVRPETEDTIVLMKQYYKNGEWLPVPGVSHIFDREALKEAMKTNGVHPTVSSSSSTQRDRILTPGKYAFGGEEFVTRYRYHDYYACCNTTDGVSQEENQLISFLRDRLKLAQRNEGQANNEETFTPGEPNERTAIINRC